MDTYRSNETYDVDIKFKRIGATNFYCIILSLDELYGFTCLTMWLLKHSSANNTRV